ncbi:hypothetical protein [Deinococcus aluminii]|uniref:DoxX family protein n=1 Tax=Deinococcus aluminii TaxID=1656885 RepID=A0ABP9XGV5_9DEIO
MVAPLIPFLLGVLAFAALLLPEPTALAGVTLPNLWFGEPRFPAWAVLTGMLKIGGTLLLTVAAQLQVERWGWSSLRVRSFAGGAVLFSLLLMLALPRTTESLAGLLLLIFAIGVLLAMSAGKLPGPKAE